MTPFIKGTWRYEKCAKAKPEPLREKKFGFLVRQMGLEPIRSRTRPSNVPVCLFQHCRTTQHEQYSKTHMKNQ